MSNWTRVEIQTAFDRFVATMGDALIGGKIAPWLSCLTEDAVYGDRGAGIGWDREVRGRDGIGRWFASSLANVPQATVRYRPVAWSIIDETKGWVVCEWRNRLADPGDGQVYEWRAYARLFYAGDSRWSLVEEIYNATAARMVGAEWMRARAAAGGQMPPIDPRWGSAMDDADTDGAPAPRIDIEAALLHFDEVCQRAFLSHDHEEWVQCFTEDVVYREMAMQMDGTWFPEMRGRDAARNWINTVFNQFPIDRMMLFPVAWSVIDEARGWVVLEWRNQMADPGTGELFEERSYTRLKYGGNGRFRFEEDIYDPSRMREMILRWMEARRRVLERPLNESLSTLASPPATQLPPA
jgi:ketosteroid isomerase-like protein